MRARIHRNGDSSCPLYSARAYSAPRCTRSCGRTLRLRRAVRHARRRADRQRKREQQHRKRRRRPGGFRHARDRQPDHVVRHRLVLFRSDRRQQHRHPPQSRQRRRLRLGAVQGYRRRGRQRQEQRDTRERHLCRDHYQPLQAEGHCVSRQRLVRPGRDPHAVRRRRRHRRNASCQTGQSAELDRRQRRGFRPEPGQRPGADPDGRRQRRGRQLQPARVPGRQRRRRRRHPHQRQQRLQRLPVPLVSGATKPDSVEPCCWTPSTRPTATMPTGCCAMRS